MPKSIMKNISHRFLDKPILQISLHVICLCLDESVWERTHSWKKLSGLGRFDANFFDIPPEQANYLDPRLRCLLELTTEAIFDAGNYVILLICLALGT